jgi:hypothetical protein
VAASPEMDANKGELTAREGPQVTARNKYQARSTRLVGRGADDRRWRGGAEATDEAGTEESHGRANPAEERRSMRDRKGRSLVRRRQPTMHRRLRSGMPAQIGPRAT